MHFFWLSTNRVNEKLYARQVKPTGEKNTTMAGKTVQSKDRNSDQALYEEVCCVFFYGLPV